MVWTTQNTANRVMSATSTQRTSVVEAVARLMATVAINLVAASTTTVLWVEVVLISLFAVFWLVQTKELWNRGLRGP